MMTLFDDEYILKSYVKSKEKEATKEVARTMYDTGDSLERIAQVFKMSIKEVEEWLELLKALSTYYSALPYYLFPDILK